MDTWRNSGRIFAAALWAVLLLHLIVNYVILLSMKGMVPDPGSAFFVFFLRFFRML